VRRDDVNEAGLAIVVVVVALLVADCIWLHMRCARQEAEMAALSTRVETLVKLSAAPQGQDDPAFVDKALKTIEKVKSAAVKGYEAARDELTK
jgi:cell division protein FtsX